MANIRCLVQSLIDPCKNVLWPVTETQSKVATTLEERLQASFMTAGSPAPGKIKLHCV